MQVRGKIRHKNFSPEKFFDLKKSLKFIAVEDGEFYFKIIKPFSGFEKGQVVKVRTSNKKITLIAE